jgi:hypothetical protein
VAGEDVDESYSWRRGGDRVLEHALAREDERERIEGRDSDGHNL